MKLHPMRGFEVEGLSRTRIETPHHGRRAIQEGKTNRKTQVRSGWSARRETLRGFVYVCVLRMYFIVDLMH